MQCLSSSFLFVFHSFPSDSTIIFFMASRYSSDIIHLHSLTICSSLDTFLSLVLHFSSPPLIACRISSFYGEFWISFFFILIIIATCIMCFLLKMCVWPHLEDGLQAKWILSDAWQFIKYLLWLFGSVLCTTSFSHLQVVYLHIFGQLDWLRLQLMII